MRKILLVLVILAWAAVTSAETSIRELENQQAQFEQAAEQARARTEWLQKKIDSLSDAKRKLDAEAAAAATDYEQKKSALDETVRRIEQAEVDLVANERDFQKKHNRLAQRVRDIYINGRISYLDVMFGAQDFGDFITRMDLLKRILVFDSDLVTAVLAQRAEIEALASQLESDRKIQAEQARFAEKAREFRQKKVAEQQALIDLMENDKAVYNQRYDEMAAASKEVARLIEESKLKAAAESAAREQAAAERAARAERERVAREQRQAQERLIREQRLEQERLEREQERLEHERERLRLAEERALERARREQQRLTQAQERELAREAREKERAAIAQERALERANRRRNSVEYVRPFEDAEVYAPAGTGEMLYPLVGAVTSEFGWRTHPIFGGSKFHSGIDIAGEAGAPILAARGGVVTHSGWIDGYGNTVMIDHGDGLVTLYGHNQSVAVTVGQKVKQGQVIAYCGSTGNSTGPHCHFEVRKNGEPVSP